MASSAPDGAQVCELGNQQRSSSATERWISLTAQVERRSTACTRISADAQRDPSSPSRVPGWVVLAADGGGIDQDSAAECGGEASAPRASLRAANARVGLRGIIV